MCVERLSKHYAQHTWFTRRKRVVKALDGVDLKIYPGCTHALVGESGSGKSTLARCLARLEAPSSGSIRFEDRDLLHLTAAELFSFRQLVQLIFQDPATALNPRLCAAEIIEEPLAIQHRGTKRERRERSLALMEQVGLSPGWAERLPLELSGGQRQRLAIARALALEPKFLILDEALSGLDVSVQAQVVNLLLDLQASRSLTYLYISHDLSLVGCLADEVTVMHRGRVVERGKTAELFAAPQHPHTRALLGAMPVLERAGQL
ncbi:MAG: ATP-binding cassette domain-containing protein [Terriglobia bacterium]